VGADLRGQEHWELHEATHCAALVCVRDGTRAVSDGAGGEGERLLGGGGTRDADFWGLVGDARQTLFAPEIGYQILDVRSEYEVNTGKVPGATNIPLINVKSRWSSETGERTFDQTPNADFLNMVRPFPPRTVLVTHATSARGAKYEPCEQNKAAAGNSRQRARQPTFPVLFWLVHVLSNKPRD